MAAQFSGGVSQRLIEGPERDLLEHCRGEEMDVDPTSALSTELMSVDKRQKRELLTFPLLSTMPLLSARGE